MTLCNMSIEAGARAAMIAPDETTFDYMKGRRFVPRDWDEASFVGVLWLLIRVRVRRDRGN